MNKEVCQRRRVDLGRTAERIAAEIAKLEKKLKIAEIVQK